MSRRRYLNFVTKLGNDLARVARSGIPRFLVHDCGYVPQHSGWNHPGVDSPFWRFYHNSTAGFFITCQNRRISLRPSHCVLIPEDTLFDCHGPHPASHFWIHFSVAPHRPAASRAPLEVAVDRTLSALLGDARALAGADASPVRDQQLYHATCAVLHAAFRRFDFVTIQPASDALSDVCTFIHAEPGADLSNATLALRAGMSVRKFTERFSAHTGTTPAQFVRDVRIRLAREALALGGESIEQIADSLGFPNRYYFTRVFTDLAGCSPAEYRRRHNSGGVKSAVRRRDA